MSLRMSAFAVVLGAGCMTGALDEPPTDNVQQAIGLDPETCDEFMCGTNSPQIAEFGFWELNLPTVLGTPGLPNNVGMQLLDFVQGTDVYLPTVRRGRLSATRVTTSGTVITLSGAALVHGAFELVNRGKLFRLTVSAVGSVKSWAQPADVLLRPPVMLETYKLDWTELNQNGTPFSDPVNMCKHPPNVEDPTTLGMTGDFAYQTLLFEGDRIDARKKLDTRVNNSWFNLGCAGSALAKMALTGHTEASANAHAFSTTLAERQTMLKMLAADYCGDGTPFTVGGQPLSWRDDAGTMKLLGQPLVLEARWTDKGAACLDKPRIDAHWTVAGSTQFGVDVAVYDQVRSHCPASMPPQCADSSFEVDGYHLLTATVPFQP
jgi:hypothetical protein